MYIKYCSSSEVQSFVYSDIQYSQEKEKIGLLEIKNTSINKYKFLVSLYLSNSWYFTGSIAAEIYNIFHWENNHRQDDSFSLPYQSIISNYVCSEKALKISTELVAFISNFSGNPFVQKVQSHNYPIFNKNKKLNLEHKHKLLWKEEFVELKITTNSNPAIISSKDILAITKSIKRI